MKVLYKNAGEYCSYSIDGSVLSFRGGELSLDLEDLSRDYPVCITVSGDERGLLSTGVSRRYVAEIAIPARQSKVGKTGVADSFGFAVLQREYEPFDPGGVELTLWAES